MKAVDFIKKFWWLKAISVRNHFFGVFEYKARDGEILFSFQVDDLKQYINAYELVQCYGGFNCVKYYVKNTKNKTTNLYQELQKAIALVEEVCGG